MSVYAASVQADFRLPPVQYFKHQRSIKLQYNQHKQEFLSVYCYRVFPTHLGFTWFTTIYILATVRSHQRASTTAPHHQHLQYSLVVVLIAIELKQTFRVELIC